MEEIKFYSGDPLARVLIEKLRFTPIVFALIPAIVGLGYGFFFSWVSGTLLARSGQTGFFQDWIGWIWRLFLGPAVAGYYLWSSNAMKGLVHRLQKSEVVEISSDDIFGVLNYYHKPWRAWLSGGFTVIYGVLYFISRSDVQAWVSAGFAPRFVSTIAFSVGGYIISMISLTLILNVWSLRKILHNKDIVVNPLHPDRCGGLKALSDYSLKTAYLAAIAGLVIGLTEYRFITQADAREYILFHASIPLYIAIASVCFFAPLSTTHQKMKEAKDKLLHSIAKQFIPVQSYKLCLCSKLKIYIPLIKPLSMLAVSF